MKQTVSLYQLLLLLLLAFQSCTVDTVKIGTQTWMVHNLDVDKFSNGDLIPHADTPEKWKLAAERKMPAWCYFNNDATNGPQHGRLYNWYAIIDERGLAPRGWHIPTDSEWTELTTCLGGELQSGTKLKNTHGWKNKVSTNTTGFSAFPSGTRSSDGHFGYFGLDASFWSSTEVFGIYGWNRYLRSEDDAASRVYSYKGDGLSVRCIKDADQ